MADDDDNTNHNGYTLLPQDELQVENYRRRRQLLLTIFGLGRVIREEFRPFFTESFLRAQYLEEQERQENEEKHATNTENTDRLGLIEGFLKLDTETGNDTSNAPEYDQNILLELYMKIMTNILDEIAYIVANDLSTAGLSTNGSTPFATSVITDYLTTILD